METSIPPVIPGHEGAGHGPARQGHLFLGTAQGPGSATVSVLLDGDSIARTLPNATGRDIVFGERVVVDFSAPHGAWVLGVLGGSSTTGRHGSFGADGETTVTTNTQPQIDLTRESWNPWGWTLASGAFVVPYTGRWLIDCHAAWDPNASGVRVLVLKRNGVAIGRQDVTATNSATLGTMNRAVSEATHDVGDTITAEGYQNSGGNLDVAGSSSVDFQFRATYLGPTGVT